MYCVSRANWINPTNWVKQSMVYLFSLYSPPSHLFWMDIWYDLWSQSSCLASQDLGPTETDDDEEIIEEEEEINEIIYVLHPF